MFKNKSSADSLVFYVSKQGEDFKLSRNFVLREMQSRDGSDKVLVHPALLILLQQIRDEFGHIHITSGYRSPKHNENVGGAPASTHLYGMAADIVPVDAELLDVYEYLKLQGIGGLKLYPDKDFIHIDVSRYRRW